MISDENDTANQEASISLEEEASLELTEEEKQAKKKKGEELQKQLDAIFAAGPSDEARREVQNMRKFTYGCAFLVVILLGLSIFSVLQMGSPPEVDVMVKTSSNITPASIFTISITVKNTGSSPVKSLMLSFPLDFFQKFDYVSSQPSAKKIKEYKENRLFFYNGLGAGEERTVVLSFKAPKKLDYVLNGFVHSDTKQSTYNLNISVSDTVAPQKTKTPEPPKEIIPADADKEQDNKKELDEDQELFKSTI